jgi:hypothetical protein
MDRPLPLSGQAAGHFPLLWPLVSSVWQLPGAPDQLCHSRWWTLLSQSPRGCPGCISPVAPAWLERSCSWCFLEISSEMGAVLCAGTSQSLLRCIQEQLLTESGKGNWSLQPSWRLYNVAMSFRAQNRTRLTPLLSLDNPHVAWLVKRKSVSLKFIPKKKTNFIQEFSTGVNNLNCGIASLLASWPWVDETWCRMLLHYGFQFIWSLL